MLSCLSEIVPPGSSYANRKKKIIFIVGPTGVGKTEVAIKLASKINAEIISCDSMQVYKKMDIISSKPSVALRGRIKHYLIDILSPEEEYNAANYQRQAALKIKEILKKGKVALFVGGTGFYMSVLLDGLFNKEIKNRKIRDRLYRQAEKYGREKLYEKLKRVDPEAALKIHPHDLRRVIRAMEVYLNTKIPISELQKKRKSLLEGYDVKIFCLNRDRKGLYKRIDMRVDSMFKKGLVKEVKKLLALRLSKTASYAIGIREIKGYLNGRHDLDETKCLIKRNTKSYAKRQLTWFKKDKRIEWVGVGEKEKPASVANKIFERLKR